MDGICETSDLLFFSNLRWDFSFQRLQHFMSRFARYRRVYYVEEPLLGKSAYPGFEHITLTDRINIIIPQMPADINSAEMDSRLKELIDELLSSEKIEDYSIWYYTPMALPFTRHLRPEAVLYDCMDEISGLIGYGEEKNYIVLNEVQ